jgi:hypothetical protein
MSRAAAEQVEVEILISGVFDRRPTVTPLFLKKPLNAIRYIGFARGPSWDADLQRYHIIDVFLGKRCWRAPVNRHISQLKQ